MRAWVHVPLFNAIQEWYGLLVGAVEKIVKPKEVIESKELATPMMTFLSGGEKPCITCGL